ncbi:MAG TPA: SDR family oxidoreductase [Bacillota bacterium]|nr:SDR family oxidoreductase [Bacillota bacterium]
MTTLMKKTAIVTGASTGIGSAIATHLAMEGVDVCLLARNEEKLKEKEIEIKKVAKGNILTISADVSNREDVQMAIKETEEKLGTIDFYINNAGQMLNGIVTEGQVEDWEKMIDVNIKGILYGIHEVLPTMKKQSFGHIVNIASVSGLEVTKNSTVYSATKFAVRAISMGLEKELARTGVRVTNISPGMVQTDLTASYVEKDAHAHQRERVPLQTEDIARAVIYALSQPTYVNVNEITVRPV